MSFQCLLMKNHQDIHVSINIAFVCWLNPNLIVELLYLFVYVYVYIYTDTYRLHFSFITYYNETLQYVYLSIHPSIYLHIYIYIPSIVCPIY